MSKIVAFLFLVCLVSQTTQFKPFDDAMIMKELQRELKEKNISLEEFLKSAINDDDFNENEISQLNPEDQRFSSQSPLHREPDFSFNAQQMIEFRGFRYEAHEVVTQDCHILTMHRVVQFYFVMFLKFLVCMF